MKEYQCLIVSDSIMTVRANSPQQARHVAIEELKKYPDHFCRVAEVFPKGEERKSFPADHLNPPPLNPTPTQGGDVA